MRPLFCLIVLSAILGCGSPGAADDPATETGAAAPLDSEDDKTLYALGFAMAQRISGAGFLADDIAKIQAGLGDGLSKRDAQVAMQEFGPKIDALIQSRVALAADAEREESRAYCETMAATEGAVKTAAGAIYIEVEAGTGATPASTDTVKLHYHGTLRDGTVFDSSLDRGQPASFPLNGVVPCFSEGIQKMKVGGKAKLVCPPETAYGDRGSPPRIPPGAAINFEVELLEIASAAAGATPSP